jgi:hypothetical protein
MFTILIQVLRSSPIISNDIGHSPWVSWPLGQPLVGVIRVNWPPFDNVFVFFFYLLGAVIHPIMLNALLHGPIGFANGVRISTGFNAALLIIANLLMRARLPPKKVGSAIPIAEFARDPPYLFTVIGYAPLLLPNYVE